MSKGAYRLWAAGAMQTSFWGFARKSDIGVPRKHEVMSAAYVLSYLRWLLDRVSLESSQH